MSDEIYELLDAESDAAEQMKDGDSDVDVNGPIARGHPRSRTLQVRLSPEEYERIQDAADVRGIPVSTMARAYLLQVIEPADDLKDAVDRLERNVAELRRQLEAE